ncbi:hypothetical protein [Bradyrhizobium sp. USDA 4486]
MAVTEPRDDIGIVFQKPILLPWFDFPPPPTPCIAAPSNRSCAESSLYSGVTVKF